MGILDDAIREHLDLKRQHGARDSELREIEDDAFGGGERPDPFAAGELFGQSAPPGQPETGSDELAGPTTPASAEAGGEDPTKLVDHPVDPQASAAAPPAADAPPADLEGPPGHTDRDPLRGAAGSPRAGRPARAASRTSRPPGLPRPRRVTSAALPSERAGRGGRPEPEFPEPARPETEPPEESESLADLMAQEEAESEPAEPSTPATSAP